MQIKLKVPYGLGTTVQTFNVGPKPNSRSKKITHIKIRQQVDFYYVALDTAIESLQKLKSLGLEGGHLELVAEHDYGDEYTRLYYEGWRPMTKEELQATKEAQEAEQEQRKEFERRELERLRNVHPEWLKRELREG